MENSKEISIEQLQEQITELQSKIEGLENSRKDQLSIAVVSVIWIKYWLLCDFQLLRLLWIRR